MCPYRILLPKIRHGSAEMTVHGWLIDSEGSEDEAFDMPDNVQKCNGWSNKDLCSHDRKYSGNEPEGVTVKGGCERFENRRDYCGVDPTKYRNLHIQTRLVASLMLMAFQRINYLENVWNQGIQHTNHNGGQFQVQGITPLYNEESTSKDKRSHQKREQPLKNPNLQCESSQPTAAKHVFLKKNALTYSGSRRSAQRIALGSFASNTSSILFPRKRYWLESALRFSD